MITFEEYQAQLDAYAATRAYYNFIGPRQRAYTYNNKTGAKVL